MQERAGEMAQNRSRSRAQESTGEKERGQMLVRRYRACRCSLQIASMPLWELRNEIISCKMVR